MIFEAKQLPGMAGQELASRVTCGKPYGWDKGSVEVAISPWSEQMGESDAQAETRKHRVVAYDYGIKQNICACSWTTPAKSTWSRRKLPRKTFWR